MPMGLTGIRLLALTLILYCFGCATVGKSLESANTQKIKNIALITNSLDDKLRVFQHSSAWLFFAVEDFAEKEKAGSNPAPLREKIGDYPLQSSLELIIKRRLAQSYDVKSIHNSAGSKADGIAIENYASEAKAMGADTILAIDYFYGIEAYSKGETGAVINAFLSVYDLTTNALLIKKRISSETYYISTHRFDEFLADNGQLFKDDLSKALDGLSLRVATEFGVDMEEAAKRRAYIDETIINLLVSCNEPYKLERDCSSFSGPQRKIVIKGNSIKLAASNDGGILWLQSASFLRDSVLQGLSLNSLNLVTSAAEDSLAAIAEELYSKGIGIAKLIRVLDGNSIAGYILVLTDDGYSALAKFAE